MKKTFIGDYTMKIELYQAETEKTCRIHKSILDDVAKRKSENDIFSDLEINGIIHSLQVIIENSIGKAKHLLKYHQHEIPVSAHDAFESLKTHGLLNAEEFKLWQKIIGFRNTIVHEYMNVDYELVDNIVKNKEYQFIVDFLKRPFE